jgi:hypothetical protein
MKSRMALRYRLTNQTERGTCEHIIPDVSGPTSPGLRLWACLELHRISSERKPLGLPRVKRYYTCLYLSTVDLWAMILEAIGTFG